MPTKHYSSTLHPRSMDDHNDGGDDDDDDDVDDDDDRATRHLHKCMLVHRRQQKGRLLQQSVRVPPSHKGPEILSTPADSPKLGCSVECKRSRG